MRLLLASVATLATVALAAPVFAQDATPAAPTTTPASTSTPTSPTPTPSTTGTTKHKPAQGTAAYCNTLKSSTSKSSCLKRVHAQNTTPKAGTTTTTHKKGKKPATTDTTKTDTSASAAPTPSSTPAPSTSQTIIPPLPQKTI
jgi:hypothetical protein